MNCKNRRLFVYIAFLVTLIIAAVALRTAACLTELDPSTGYFDSKGLVTAGNAVALTACFCVFTFLFTGKRVNIKADFSHPALIVTSGVTAVAEVFMAGSLLLKVDKSSTAPLFSIETLAKPANLLALVSAAVALVSVVHLFLNVFFEERHNVMRAGFAIATVVFLSLYASYLYFNNELPLNAPNKIVDQMSFLFAALFFLYEARISLGREKWKGYSAFGMIALCLCAYSALPSLIAYFVDKSAISVSVEDNMLTLSLFVYIFSRLLVTVNLPEDKESSAIAVLNDYATSVAQQVTDNENKQLEPIAVQLTIDDLLEEGCLPYEETIAEDEVKEPDTTDEESEEIPAQESLFDDETMAAEALRTIPDSAINDAMEEVGKEEKELSDKNEEECPAKEEVIKSAEETDEQDKIDEIEMIRTQYSSIDNIYAADSAQDSEATEEATNEGQISLPDDIFDSQSDKLIPKENNDEGENE